MASLKSPPIKFHFLESFSLSDRGRIKQFIGQLFRKEGARLNKLNYIFCSDAYLLQLNQEHLNHDYFTDIITFNLASAGEPVLAEIYISVDRVRENAKNLNYTFRQEMLRVMFHGVLHLCGYMDKTKQQQLEMRQKEDYYLTRFLNGKM